MTGMTKERAQELLDGIAPTPWRIAPTDDTVVKASDRSEVADITGDYNDPDLWPIMEANARLIAAAPDLARAYLDTLAALEAARAENEALRAERDKLLRENGILRGNAKAQGLVDEIGATGKNRRKTEGKLARTIEGQRAALRKLQGVVERHKAELTTLRASLAQAEAQVKAMEDALQDPLVVHLNMVAGKIAKPLPSQLVHIYGEEAIRAALTASDASNGREG